jgi:hypothetical protein
MEASFHVQLIGTFGEDLVCAPADVNASKWLKENGADFDQFPVKAGRETIGILHRADVRRAGSVRDVMLPLREGIVVSADMPITDLIPQLRENAYRLILRGAGFDGLVTQSDLLKLPVRLVAFGVITHLEQVMADLIDTHWPDASWLRELSIGRQEKISAKQADLRRKLMNPPMVELTEFADKRTLCKKLVEEHGKQFDDDLDGLRDLRDQLAHASTFIDPANGQPAVAKFVDRFESARRWIRELTDRSRLLRGYE